VEIIEVDRLYLFNKIVCSGVPCIDDRQIYLLSYLWIDEFETQLLCVCALFKDDIRQLSTVAELADFLIVNLLFTAVHGFLLFLTLPVTVATAERSFSKLKLIKTHLSNTMQQDWLKGLAILSIENAVARELDVSKIIDDFASQKEDRVQNILYPTFPNVGVQASKYQ